ncbi:electron transport complex subunit RsxG [Kangiella profundi]|uniref:Ion-translocating oxidoreductase complex subunit G n=1 Tax=Kangiella profundi TaxID=1561924 RepID=A0A2K9ATN3_9GAMM|nr:electron transport complex subunit RsxG [Kangiella profundi]AUD78521.1 electron transport complex subunit RsxG [Kangiella profundi]GGF08606.1 electron transport complex subunit G [Kangiella profundi]
MLTKMISKNGLILAIFAAVCVGLIAVTFYITRDTIAGEMEAALARTLNQLVSENEYDNDVYHDCTLIQDATTLGSKNPLKAYRMRKDGEPIAVVMESIAPNGYSGKIAMVVGIYQDGTIAGVRVTDHKETPGLGDKVDSKKSDWILGFEGKSLSNPEIEGWAVSKDGGQFDAFTGATITPRAVIQQVATTLEFFEDNKQQLFEGPQNCGGAND